MPPPCSSVAPAVSRRIAADGRCLSMSPVAPISGNPLLDGRLRTGAAAFFGWPDDPAMEELSERWLGATDDIEQKHIAVRIQETALADVLYVPLGRYVTNSAWRSNVSGILKSNQPVMWNISKS